MSTIKPRTTDKGETWWTVTKDDGSTETHFTEEEAKAAASTTNAARETPGPWTLKYFGREDHIGRDLFVEPVGKPEDWICRMSIDARTQANARLISAAPELLAELRNIIADIDAGRMLTANRTAKARAAIAKATGREGK